MILLIARLEKYCILGFGDYIDKETIAVVELARAAHERWQAFGE